MPELNTPADLAAVQDALGIIPTEDLPAATGDISTAKIAALQGVTPGFVTPAQIAAVGNTLANRQYSVFFDEISGRTFNGGSLVIGGIWCLQSAGVGEFNQTPFTADQFGGSYFTKGTSSTGRASMVDDSNAAGRTYTHANLRHTWTTLLQFRPVTGGGVPDATDNYVIAFGMGLNSTAWSSTDAHTAQIAYRFNGTAAELVCRTSDATTVTSTALTLPTSGEEATWEIVVNGTTNVVFKKNGVVVATHTTNLPVSGQARRQGIGVWGSAGTNPRAGLVRYFTYRREII